MIKRLKKDNSIAFTPIPQTSHFHLEMDRTTRGFHMAVGGVKRIVDYTPNYIKLSLLGFSMLISGEDLKVSVYESKTVEISGNILKTEFLYAKT